MEKILQKRTLICKSVKSKTVAAILAVIAAVALPQIFHGLGIVSGLGSKLGEVFLPMHVAIFLVGYFAGPWAGFAAGCLSPAVSFGLTAAAGEAMPALAMLPYMMVELAVYGLATGFLASHTFKGIKLPALATLFTAQVLGRALRALALVIGVSAFGFGPRLSVIWESILTGLPGLMLQWIVVPLLVFWVEKKAKLDE